MPQQQKSTGDNLIVSADKKMILYDYGLYLIFHLEDWINYGADVDRTFALLGNVNRNNRLLRGQVYK